MKRLIEPGKLSLGILASGRGSNFDAICAAIARQDLNARIAVVLSDKADAAVIEKATHHNIKNFYVDPTHFDDQQAYERRLLAILEAEQVNLVVLAGYMRLVGKTILQAYRNRVVNIHPALLPAFKGLHAQRQAVEYGVRFSGCTIHLVDEGIDSGPIIMQAVVPVMQDDDEDSLATRILVEEHQSYWKALQLMAQGRVWLKGRRVFII